ncbi:right-handed parallel beta-helix repeat-containing protein [Novipirellula artificiosorum]|nr:right-handed parallel beta-helix repeat-containing protein [Novipirellula artificiosorum]
MLQEHLEERALLASWSGTLTSDTTWTNGEVHQITDDLQVAADVTLTIAPGAIVKFRHANVELFVDGTLHAEGTPTAPIVFTSIHDDVGEDTNANGNETAPAAGNWARIVVNGSAVISNTDVRYGGYYYGAMVLGKNGDLTLSSSSLSHSAFDALRLEGTDATLVNNSFTANADAAISMDLNSNPTMNGVALTANGINGLQVDAGVLKRSLAWDDPDIVYWLDDDISVPVGMSLEIGAGQIVKPSNANAELHVNGRLAINGTEAAPVVFTSFADDSRGGDTNGDGDTSVPAPGNWARIQVLDESAGNTVNYFEAHYGGYYYGHALRAVQTGLMISNSTFTRSQHDAVRLEGTDATLTNNAFTTNADAAMSMDLNSNPTINGVALTVNGINGLQVDAGVLKRSLAWDDPDIVYWLDDDISVPVGMSLEIGAGQIVKPSNANAELHVNGSLAINGTEAAPVVFTSFADDTRGGDTNGDGDTSAPAPGNWARIQMLDESAGNTLNYFEAHYGGYYYGHTLRAAATDLAISNSTFTTSQSGAVRLEATDAILNSNAFLDNGDAAVSMDLSSNPDIDGVTLSGNRINGLQVNGGSLTKDLVWDDPDIVYWLDNDIFVPVGMSLEIGAGQIVKPSNANVELHVNGSLAINGTEAAPVVFTSFADDSRGGDTNGDGDASAPAPGNWARIDIRSGSGDHVIDNAVFEYGGYYYGGMLTIDNASVEVSRSWLSHSASDAVRSSGGASAELTNNVLVNNTNRGILATSQSHIKAINNTLDGNSYGAVSSETGSSIELFNNVITYHRVCGVAVDSGAGVVMAYNNIYNPASTNVIGAEDPIDVNGNLSRDPLFFSRGRTGDYRPFAGSPLIDAGLSTGNAFGVTPPATDHSGNPRYDDPGIEPNVGEGLVKYYDIGAFERQMVSDPEADLQIQLMAAPSNVMSGEEVTLTWKVSNLGPNTVTHSWIDSIDLIGTPTGQPARRVLEVVHADGLGVGQSYTKQATIMVPGFWSGDYIWRVSTDARYQVFEAQQEQNNVVESSIVALDVPELLVGQTISSAFTTEGNQQWFRIPVTAGQNLRVTLDREGALGRTELFVGHEYAPNRDSFDIASNRFGGPDANLDIGNAAAGNYYVLAQETSFTEGPIAFELSAELLDFAVDHVNPTRGGNTGNVTVKIAGNAIPSDTTAQLIDARGHVIDSVATHWIDSSQIMATFDLSAAMSGPAELKLISGGIEKELADAFTVQDGGDAGYFSRITGPSFMRVDRQNEFTVTWGNRGTVDAPVHLAYFETTGVSSLSLTPGGPQIDGGHMFLAMSPDSLASVIPPGNEQSFKVYASTSEPGDFSLRLRTIPITATELLAVQIDWDRISSVAKPPSLTELHWSQLFEQLRAQLGATWASMLQIVADNSLQILQQPAGTVATLKPGIDLRPGLLVEIGKAYEALGWTPTDTALGQLADRVAGEAASRPGQVRGLVVTLQDYKGKEPNLLSTKKDMSNIRSFFRSTPEISESNFQFYSDALSAPPPRETTITAQQLEAAVKSLADSSQTDDQLLLFFSMHGVDQADPNNRSSGLVTNSGTFFYEDLLKSLAGAKAKNIVIVVDACYAHALIRRLEYYTDVPEDVEKRITIVTASDQGQMSQSRTGTGGFFTSKFLEELLDLENDRASRGGNSDGRVSVKEALKGVGKNVGGWFAPYQNPKINADAPDVVLYDPAGESKDEIEDELEDDAPTLFERITGGNIEFRGQSGRPRDPNDKASSTINDETMGWISSNQPITYTIHFENLPDPNLPPELTLPAQEVVVTDHLSTNLDWSSLELGSIGFGDTVVPLEAGQSSYQGNTSVSADPYPVHINVDFDTETGLLTWRMQSFDEQTQLYPADPFAGFLPVNDASRQGEGFVTFTIRPKQTLVDRDQIQNTAAIVFDTNDPIITNTVTNTVDDVGPESSVSVLPEAFGTASFTVQWGGSDVGDGSGIATYDIYVSQNDGPFEPLWMSSTETSRTFTGESGNTYGFASVAQDRVGNVEVAPTNADARTLVMIGAWRNPTNPFDVDNSGDVTAYDALLVINELSDSLVHDRETELLIPLRPEGYHDRYYDVEPDGKLTALDALRVINELSIPLVDPSQVSAESVALATVAGILTPTVDRRIDVKRSESSIAEIPRVASWQLSSEWQRYTKTTRDRLFERAPLMESKSESETEQPVFDEMLSTLAKDVSQHWFSELSTT